MKIISTEYSQVLASRLAEELQCELIYTEYKHFPDNEIYLKTGMPDADTVIIGSIVDNDSFVQLLLLIDACEEAENITLVLPYMGYARQDKKFNPGEPISGRAIAKALSRNVKKVIAVNIHEEHVLSFFDCPATSVSLASTIGTYVREMDLSHTLILGPDVGAANFSQDVANACGSACDHLQKVRLSGVEVKIQPKNLDVRGRDVVIVDDIISTGGTLATAAGMLHEQGATSVHAICVHGIFASGGYARLLSGGIQSVASSDTIESAASKFSAARLIAQEILHS